MVNSLLAFAIYLFLSLMFFARMLPGHFFDYYIGRDTDPSLYMWSIAWWPYVVRHHAHPFLTSLIWAPHGMNLAWVTCLPLLGIVAMPLTTTLGPLATFNIIALLLPPLAAFTAFLLCRRLSGAFIPALLGGFVFGFSPYVVGQLLSHINLILIFPIPLIAYLVARRIDESLTRASFVMLLTLALSMQFLLVLEPFAAMTFIAGVMLLLALRLAPREKRGRVISLIYEVAVAYALTAVLMSPYIYFFFAYGFPHQPLWSAILYSADLLNFVVPTSANAIGNNSFLGSIASTFPANIYEQGACIGIPLIAIATIWSRRHRSEFLTKFLIATVVVSCVLACGPFLRVAGHPVFPMPWLLIEKLPLIKSALPVRLVMYAFLALSVIFTMWLCDPLTGRTEKIVGAVATIIMLMPNPAASFWASRAPLPMFFRDGSSSRLLAADDIVLPLPYGQKGMCMLWQAASGMNFRMASALSGIQPIEIRRWPVINLFSGSVDLPEPDLQLKAFVANLGITAIVVDVNDAHVAEWKRLLSGLGIAPQEISGVLFYRIPPTAMAEYRTADPDAAALEMERRADRTRFETLISATDRYLASGGAVANLNVRALETSRLFPPEWKFDPKPDAYRDIWSGEMDKEIGVGVVGSPSALKPIIESYQADAAKIYFPFPSEWSPSGRRSLVDELLAPEISGSTSGESIHLLVMTFDATHLRQVAARISSGTALSLAVPPREASR
jgi:hypothetical protein